MEKNIYEKYLLTRYNRNPSHKRYRTDSLRQSLLATKESPFKQGLSSIKEISRVDNLSNSYSRRLSQQLDTLTATPSKHKMKRLSLDPITRTKRYKKSPLSNKTIQYLLSNLK